jgi:hypothetical protein
VSYLLDGGEYLPSGPDHKSDLGLGLNEEVTVLLGGTLGVDKSLVGSSILGSVLDGVGGSGLPGLGTGLLLGGANLSKRLEELGVSLLLLEDVLGDGLCDNLGGGGFGGGGLYCGLGLCPKTKHTRKYDVSQPAQELCPAQLVRQEKRGRQSPHLSCCV